MVREVTNLSLASLLLPFFSREIRSRSMDFCQRAALIRRPSLRSWSLTWARSAASLPYSEGYSDCNRVRSHRDRAGLPPPVEMAKVMSPRWTMEGRDKIAVVRVIHHVYQNAIGPGLDADGAIELHVISGGDEEVLSLVVALPVGSVQVRDLALFDSTFSAEGLSGGL